MPLPILLMLVVGGIAAIAVLLHSVGLSHRQSFDAVSARAAWMREYPDSVVAEVILSEDRLAALVRSDYGAGVVWSMGADSAARVLDAAAQVIPRSDGCVVRLQQFDAPRVYVRLKPSRIPPWLTQTVQEAHS